MIPVLFNILFLILPLVFFKTTSELFEFNKVIVLYLFTSLIVSGWLIESIKQKRFIFRRTILDIPITLYLFTLLLSTLFSIDPRTSWLGYYSRFNGGLISQICYALLYWAFVSNLNKKQSLSTMYYVLTSTAIASVLAVLEHFGFFATCGLMGFGWKESCWVQDVQTRVFSTLGQPNWLAALLVALMPLTFRKSYKYYLLSILFFVTLLFTKSRSGLLAFGIESIIFWGFIFWKDKLKYLKEFLIINILFLILFFTTEWQASLIFNKPVNNIPVANTPVLESGGTESGTIRKYVWLGALEVFKHYPIIGTGPETFAFSYPMFKPVGHNLTSEWDFIYNKAHNEYLNLLANVGILGFLSYSLLILVSLKQIAGNLQFTIYNLHSISNLKINKNENSLIIDNWKLRIGLLSGYIAILITNFFGFSVVPVSLLFFLLPALAVASSMQDVVWVMSKKLNLNQWFLVLIVLLSTFYFLHSTFKYWRADIYFNKNQIEKAILISPNEANFVSKLALTDGTIETAFKALDLNQYNQNSRRILISNLVKNADTDPNNLKLAENVIKDGIKLSPNDPKLYYQLGILQLKIAKNNEAIANLEKAILLKSNYKEGRYALGMTYKSLNKIEQAKKEFEYILINIDPNDESVKKYLEELN